MSKEVSWDSLMNVIDDTWSYELLGGQTDNYLLIAVDDSRLMRDEIISNGFRKRKHNEYSVRYNRVNSNLTGNSDFTEFNYQRFKLTN